MIKQLASLFRISLSKGRTIIEIRDEIQHAENYCNIQRIRFKDSFKIKFDIPEDIMECCTVKLIVQPIIENAINYGVKEMDEDGEITVRGYRKDDDIYIDISDNGFGMTEEAVSNIFTDTEHVHAKGSGVGLINVQSRLSLIFGDKYGLIVKSEPDEGTTVSIHIPYILYNEESRKRLEGGNTL
jgi:two-component system sensor histidine kinase YesM